MVIYKLDEKLGQLTPTDASKPYIVWRDPASTGVYRDLVFFIKSNRSDLKFKLDDPEDKVVFQFYTPGNVPTDWGEIGDYLSTQYNPVPVGPVDGFYWYQIILVGKSDVAGEFITSIRETTTNESISIGMSFHDENEALRMQLANQGVEIPESVCRAIYSSDVYEENPDWILLNEKRRGLLMNFLQIVGGKGSYGSLGRALDWFGYGDLIELKEVWRYDSPDGTKMFESYIQHTLTPEIKSWLFNSVKTTYFTLSGRVDAGYRWPLEEMRLKMVLLGNFLETYFMPIHTGLIRSIMEDICIHEIEMIFHPDDIHLESCFNNARNIDMQWTSDQRMVYPDGFLPDGTLDPGTTSRRCRIYLYLDEVSAIAGLPRGGAMDNAFETGLDRWVLSETIYKDLPYIPIVACHDLDEPNVEMNDYTPDLFQQIYFGIGAKVRMEFRCKENIVSAFCYQDIHGTPWQLDFHHPTGQSTFPIQFLFQQVGDYHLLMEFIGVSGNRYSKVVDVQVTHNIVPDIEFMTLKAKVGFGGELPNPFSAIPNQYTGPANLSMFSRIKEKSYTTSFTEESGYTVDFLGDASYSQYIPMGPYRPDINDPMDIPYMTDVYYAAFSGSGAYNRMQEFISQPIPGGRLMDHVWRREGYSDPDNPEDSESCWVQMVSRTRGREFQPDYQSCQEHYVKKVWIPEFMKLEPITDIEVSRRYPIVCIPVIKIHIDRKVGGTTRKVPYSHYHGNPSDIPAWSFFSWNLQKDIHELTHNILEPFMAWDQNSPIPTGYYTVKFRYDFGTGIHEVTKDTPFKLID